MPLVCAAGCLCRWLSVPLVVCAAGCLCRWLSVPLFVCAAGRSSGHVSRVAVAALELAPRSARARVVAAHPAVLVPGGRAPARLHVRPAVDRRRRVLQPLRAARCQPGRDRGSLVGRGLSVRATGLGPGRAVTGAGLLRVADLLPGAASL